MLYGSGAPSVWTPDGRVQIEPVSGEGRYASAYLADLAVSGEAAVRPACGVAPTPEEVAEGEELIRRAQQSGAITASGDQLFTYRLAVAATGEYTLQHGGTVAGGLAGVVETINRVTEIMTQEWSVALELVPDNDLIIFTDGATDPYSNGNTGAMLGQNQTTCTSIIGSANYDQGHVFGTGPGGVAQLRSVCSTTSKARGVSTGFSTSGEGFALLVAHEMGHQYGANHSFNGDAGNCGPNRSSSAAYEPGSGSTIMSYAGTCGDQDLQFTSHDYYQSHSYVEVNSNVTTGTASTCPTITATGNAPPVATVDPTEYNLPLDTPWRMDGVGTDADGDSLTYCWEEHDLGPAGHPDLPVDNAPIFRSRYPKTVAHRFFPKFGNILNGNQSFGELLPTYQRRVRLRLTVRDGLGGVAWDQVRVWPDSSAGPFDVTSQATNESWEAGTQQLVTWDVAGTDNGIINCQTVNILLSEGGGEDFPHVLAAGTPNDGSELVTVPFVELSGERVMVQAADNIFYQLSEGDVAVTLPTTGVVATL
ncbi:hypothetical protein K8I85_15225, partial [bacterium]|nr:hypothetical protein [bacterium]